VYATSDGGSTWQLVAASDTSLIIAATDAQHVWGFGQGELISTVDASGDVAAPATLDDADQRWHSAPVTLHLWPNDIGGSGLASTQHSLDNGLTWQTGTTLDFAAPADHSQDGRHEVLYRSTDVAGNVEPTERVAALIDTLGPTCSAPRKSVVNAGARCIIGFNAADATSGVARAEITLTDKKGRVVDTFVRRSGDWAMYPPPPYYWLRFSAKLKPGYYRITVRAIDRAGNEQVTTGRNWLHVVRSGAPRLRVPPWPAGLPDDSLLGSGLGSAPLGGAAAPASSSASGTGSLPRAAVRALLSTSMHSRLEQ
jgi:hypothetical protein